TIARRCRRDSVRGVACARRREYIERPGHAGMPGRGQQLVNRMGLRRIGIAGMALLAGLGAARADDLSLFNAAMEDVASHNLVALGYLRNENLELAVVEIERMKESWGAFAEKFSGDRPAPFRDNKLYVTMLVDVPPRIVTAMIMINFGRPDIAKNSLVSIRDEMSAVRRASKVEVLADCVLDSHAAMEALSLYRDTVPGWND